MGERIEVKGSSANNAAKYWVDAACFRSAVKRELVLRLAGLLWRLRRATTMETGLFEIQDNHLKEFTQARSRHDRQTWLLIKTTA
jgi:hypothetical protein